MSKTNWNGILREMRTAIKKHSPEILTGLGIAGMITTVILAVRATPKAVEQIKEKKKELETDKLTVQDTVKTVWKNYIPTTIVGSASTACLIAASSVNLRRNAALTTACTLSSSALMEYRDKVTEAIGEKKEQSIRDSVDKSKLEKDPICQKEIFITEKGETLCYDAISGRYFKSDIEKIKKSVNELNRRMLDDMFISLNEFYDEIGLREIDIGNMLGWNIDKGYIDLDFSSQLAENGTPCLVIRFERLPQYEYQN